MNVGLKRRLVVAVVVAGVALFAFFVPVVYPTCYPLTCRVDGHPCMGLCIPDTGSVAYWVSGYGGALVPNLNSGSIRPSVYQVFLP